MCGFFGLVNLENSLPIVECFRGAQSLSHRGPDGLGVVCGSLCSKDVSHHINPTVDELKAPAKDANFALFHRRLAVVDLAVEACQPMSNEDGDIWVVFNGEIYNHVELRRLLTDAGHRFRTHHSDTEVLVHGYEEWGEGLLQRLRGMFAFVILDLRARKLFMARDRFGEKPLYVAAIDGGIAFASEVKALLAAGLISREVDKNAIADYLQFGYIAAPRSIYKGVVKLRAAESATVMLEEPYRLDRRRYWELKYEDRVTFDERGWNEEFEARLSESIKMRLMSDVPLGAFLSGGLDSTMVVRQMSQFGRADTFNIGFKEASFDESVFASQAAQRYGARHHARLLAPADLQGQLERVGAIFDEPFADASAIPTLVVSEMARERVTVCLSGDGGDELLAGYTRYSLNRRLGQVFDHSGGRVLSGLLRPLRAIWPESRRGAGLVALLRRNARERYERIMGDPWLLNASVFSRREGQSQFSDCWDEGCAALLDRMCKADVVNYIPEDLMVKVDRTSMAASLEVRAPLLDHTLFEFVAKSPLRLRYDIQGGKVPFRKMLGADFGASFVNRPKRGFAVPLGQWFRGALKPMIRDVLLSSASFAAQVVPAPEIKRLIGLHTAGGRDQSHRIWRLLALELWSRNYGGAL